MGGDDSEDGPEFRAGVSVALNWNFASVVAFLVFLVFRRMVYQIKYLGPRNWELLWQETGELNFSRRCPITEIIDIQLPEEVSYSSLYPI
jgi:hypothetical protein